MKNQTMPMLGSMDQDQMREYLDMQRNQRLAQALTEQGSGDIKYDPRGVISPWQGAAKLAAALGGAYYQNKADKGQMEASQMQQQRLNDTFGVGSASSGGGATPQALGAALGGQQNGLVIPELGAEKSMFLYQNNPELYKEIVGKNLQLTENQKNYGGQLGAFNDAAIAAKKADAVKGYQGGETIVDMNTGTQQIAPKLVDISLGDRNVLGVQGAGGLKTTNVLDRGLTPYGEANVNFREGNTMRPEDIDYWTKEAQKIGNTDFAKGWSKQNKDMLGAALARAQVASGAQAGDYTGTGMGTAADKRLLTESAAREAKIGMRVLEARNMIPLALEASDRVNRGTFVPVNKLMNMSNEAISDPNLAQFKASTQSFLNAYTAAINNGARTIHDAEEASKMLYAAQSPEAYKATLTQLDREMDAALKSPETMRQSVVGKYTNKTEQPAQGAQSQDARDAADWIAKNPNDPKVPAIKAHYGI